MIPILMNLNPGDSGKRGHQKPRPPIAQEPVEEKCPTNWLTFDRPQGKWCVKIIHHTENWCMYL
ncbi:hypothetical protein CRE_14017 [Caenorhabditis remanei]|uniref:Uncharacterized protein n=1 Tax=Caenorhabditis remanei TaxID=31234 RepID=E3M8T9_CAERE|nr:hypothetical protein CRE_14017 [Caenorhabditis remanei]